MKSLLFINGELPKNFPKNISDYDLIACTDGAFHYLKQKNFPLEKLDFISGDFDSFVEKMDGNLREKIIETPDQNFTDFHKALKIITERGADKVDIYGASGGEQDHFIGNLHVAYLFRKQINIKFFDEFSTYYFIPQFIEIQGVKDKIISLIPFPSAKNISTQGMKWELTGAYLDITKKISLRNFAVNNSITISYDEGCLLVFLKN